MPKRFLRPGIVRSKRWNKLDWISQSFFVRLIALVDDYGRYEADPRILRSECFPLGCPDGRELPLGSIDGQMPDKRPSIASICQSLSESGMVVFYRVDDTEYLQLSRWQERVRTPSRYPAPNDGQLCAASPSPSPSPSPRESQSASLPLSSTVKEIFEAWNAAADNVRLPKCLLVSDKRRRAIEQRLKDSFFCANWRNALERIGLSEFCHGVNERGWRASFEWFITPDAVQKIMEGKYDNRSKVSAGDNPRLAGASRNNKVNNYAELARQKLERQMAEAENRTPPKAGGNGA